MKKETKEKLIITVVLYAILLVGVLLINARIDQTQKIDAEASIIENR